MSLPPFITGAVERESVVEAIDVPTNADASKRKRLRKNPCGLLFGAVASSTQAVAAAMASDPAAPKSQSASCMLFAWGGSSPGSTTNVSPVGRNEMSSARAVGDPNDQQRNNGDYRDASGGIVTSHRRCKPFFVIGCWLALFQQHAASGDAIGVPKCVERSNAWSRQPWEASEFPF